MIAENLNEETEIPPPTYNEVSAIIQKLRNNKAPGLDNIISELIKGGRKLKQKIYVNSEDLGERRTTGRLGK